MMRIAGYALAVLFVAVAVHAVAVLAVPALTRENRWATLAQVLNPNEAFVLPAASPDGQVFDEMDPEVLLAVCRYDLEPGPLRFSLPEAPSYWSLALYHLDKTAYYSFNDRSAAEVAREVYLLLPEQAPDFWAEREGATPPLVVTAPDAEGMAVLRMLVPDETLAARYRGLASEFSCTTAE